MVQTKLLRFLAVLAILCNSIASGARGNAPVIIKQELIIQAGIDQAWQVLGPQFADAYKWASSIKHSAARNHESINGSACTERGCIVSGLGNIKEKILLYSETGHLLSYQVYEGMPKMVKSAVNTWKLTDLGNGTTKLEMQVEMRTGGVMGALAKGMMRKKMKRLSKQVAEEFKYYVETGQAHPRKLKAAAKN